MDFTTLYKRYYLQLFHYSQKILLSAHIVDAKEVAEDMVEQAYMKAWEKWTSFENEENVKAFLYIVAKNNTFNYLQSYKCHAKDHAIMIKMGEQTEEPDYFAINAEVIDFLRIAIDKLPPECAKVVRLFFAEVPSHMIAQRLKITRKTALNQKLKAIEKLKKMIILKFGYI